MSKGFKPSKSDDEKKDLTNAAHRREELKASGVYGDTPAAQRLRDRMEAQRERNLSPAARQYERALKDIEELKVRPTAAANDATTSKESSLPAGVLGDMLYHDGTTWVIFSAASTDDDKTYGLTMVNGVPAWTETGDCASA